MDVGRIYWSLAPQNPSREIGSLLDSSHSSHTTISTHSPSMRNSRHGRKTEKQRINILDLLNTNCIIPSITNRASIGSMKYSREKEWQKGENVKVYSKEIEVISTIRDCFIVDRLGFGYYHFDSSAAN